MRVQHSGPIWSCLPHYSRLVSYIECFHLHTQAPPRHPPSSPAWRAEYRVVCLASHFCRVVYLAFFIYLFFPLFPLFLYFRIFFFFVSPLLRVLSSILIQCSLFRLLFLLYLLILIFSFTFLIYSLLFFFIVLACWLTFFFASPLLFLHLYISHLLYRRTRSISL